MDAPKKHSTLDSYRTLVEVQIKSVLQRMGELTSNVDQLLIEVSTQTVNLEAAVERTEQVSGRINTLREDVRIGTDQMQEALRSLNNTIKHQQSTIDDLRDRLRWIEQRLKDTEK